jgi:uncharacterized LabA/DUF88 family protein
MHRRVCIFIDNSNLFHALRNFASSGPQQKLDYIRLKDALSAGRTEDVRFYYSEPDDAVDTASGEKRASRDRFYSFLEEKLGFMMVRLPLRTRSGYDPAAQAMVNYLRTQGKSDQEILQIVKRPAIWLQQIEGAQVPEEKGLDCELVHDMVKLAHTSRYDAFVLVAGDEDYARTVSRLKLEMGMRVEVAFFDPPRCSSVLRREATKFIGLESISGLFKEREITGD